jgi:alcohol dehydrogenase class IV
MQSYQHITPALRLYTGPDSLGQLGRELARLNSQRALVVCGPWAEGPLLDAVLGAAGERCAGVFTGVLAHSPIDSVEAAAAEVKRLGVDSLIALGGGSSIVTARAASILAAESAAQPGAGVRQLCTTTGPDGRLNSPRLQAPKHPQIIIPTTPTTAMVKAGSAVFDPATAERLPLYDPKTRASSVFVHPDFIASAPVGLVVSASLNTFSLAIEGLVSRQGDPIADALLMHVLRLTAQHLANPDLASDADARADLVVAAVMCGQGTDHTAAGITTVLGHAIGARHGAENGVLNGIVLAHALRFNGTANEVGLRKVAAALDLGSAGSGEALVQAIVQRVSSLFAAIGVPQRLRDVGVPQDGLAVVADAALGDWFLRGNPRRVHNATELLSVLQNAW